MGELHGAVALKLCLRCGKLLDDTDRRNGLVMNDGTFCEDCHVFWTAARDRLWACFLAGDQMPDY